MNPNSALLWLPKIHEAGLPVPRTIVEPYSHHDCLSIFDGERSPEFERLIGVVQAACEQIGYPCFLRSDLGSAKHDGPRAYRIDEAKRAGSVLYATIEDQEMQFWLEKEGPAAMLVREFLDLDAPFVAFGGIPIAREWRFFANRDQMFCAHPYWPASALQFYDRASAPGRPAEPEPREWREQLAELHCWPAEADELSRMAIEAAKVCDGRWSVDFARDRSGKWWLIDMALMAASWHWPGCPNGGPA